MTRSIEVSSELLGSDDTASCTTPGKMANEEQQDSWRNGSDLLKEVLLAQEFWSNAPVKYSTPHYDDRSMELEVVVEKYASHRKLAIATGHVCMTTIGASRYLRTESFYQGVQFLPKDELTSLIDLSQELIKWGWPSDRAELISDCKIRVKVTQTKFGTFLIFKACPLCPRFMMLEIYRWFDTPGLPAKLLDVGESRIIRTAGYPPEDDLCWMTYSGLWSQADLPWAQPDEDPQIRREPWPLPKQSCTCDDPHCPALGRSWRQWQPPPRWPL
jgi:hypothetical protein